MSKGKISLAVGMVDAQSVNRKLLQWLLFGSKGGINRGRMLKLLGRQPMNTKQVADALNLNYKTVQHHLELLEKHDIVKPISSGYGKAYSLAEDMERCFDEFKDKFQ